MTLPLEFLSRPPSTMDPKRLLVLLHGLGSSDEDLFGLAPYIPPNFAFYCLRAPLDYFGGYKWFSLEIGAGCVSIDVEEANRSLKLVEESVRALQLHLGIGPEATVIGGFSQGAMMSHALLLRTSDLAQSGWLMSGASSPELFPKSPATYSTPPKVLVQHGEHDAVLPIDAGRLAADALGSSLHAEVRFESYPIYHSISEESLKDGANWLASL